MVYSEYKGVEDAEPLRRDPANAEDGRSVEVYDYVQSGDKMKRIVTGHALLIPLERRDFPARTVFPRKFPMPVVCSDFCGKDERCNLRENGFSDLCRYRHKLGKLVMPVDLKWSVRFNIRIDQELKARTQFTKSSISGTIPEIALSHERTEDSTFAAYSSQRFLDAFDELEDGHELEYTMDNGMVSREKSQAGAVPSFMYRTIYRDRKILLGFETKRVEKTYVETERRWIYYPPYGGFILSNRKVIRTTSYRDDVPVYKWIRIPTLRPIGCLLKPVKVVGSTTIITRTEQKFYADRREEQRVFSQFVGQRKGTRHSSPEQTGSHGYLLIFCSLKNYACDYKNGLNMGERLSDSSDFHAAPLSLYLWRLPRDHQDVGN